MASRARIAKYRQLRRSHGERCAETPLVEFKTRFQSMISPLFTKPFESTSLIVIVPERDCA